MLMKTNTNLASSFVVTLFCFSSSYADSNPPYFGMSQQHYDECIALGSKVMKAQNIKPDSPQHKSAYQTWDHKCGMQVMLPFAKQYQLKNIPASPYDWSKLR